MSRILDLVILLTALILIFTVQFAGAAMLDPLRDNLLEDEEYGEKYNAAENFDDMFVTVTKWIPLTGGLGMIGFVLYREYRRQRITGARGGGLR